MPDHPLAQRQKMFLLSFFSNLGSGLVGNNLAQRMLGVIDVELRKARPLIGRWEVVWGPAAFQSRPYSLIDNLLYVAHDRDEQQLVVSMAGTNPNSIYDWFVEDWRIGRVHPWAYGNPPEDARISEGSQIALSILQSMQPPAGLPGAGQPLASFLRSKLSLIGENTQVITTGHSLGGAVSPMVALWLQNTASEWDPHGCAKISN